MRFINQSLIKKSLINHSLLKGVKVLVIDNDRDSQCLYETLLKGCGANVISATSIQEAIDILACHLPNILICETRFIGESITTLITTLKAMEARGKKHIPAIATTTWIGESLVQALEAGFEDFLLKPIDLDRLVHLIRTLVVTGRKKPLAYSVKLKIASRQRRKMVSSL